MAMVALIPVKPLARVKSRLAGALDDKARARLIQDTLRHTILAIRESGLLETVFVLTRDRLVAAWAEDWGAHVVWERCAGLNRSLEIGRRHVLMQRRGLTRLLVAPADLGWLHAEDVTGMTALLPADGPAVVVAPDRHDQGTNALLLQPPAVIPFCFGAGSAHAHADQARARGAQVFCYHSSSTSLDVDEPADLSLYCAAPYVW
ncbi:MAG: 2-phospho-L-lactate guanylyltransferase [Anaerolineae bacterium]|nr:2-phospho-L-lactate guanylyltransferase [Thermoflexales bacterium]MDW8406151.1 2-phospho-L-lactate guanylyltransferase [Anaerolineae bacterium]